eukprot:m.353339 g.353339  ORF g.353339 m.353339 type:complete len:568 (+) comp16742_c0_seq1:300-2003(+)
MISLPPYDICLCVLAVALFLCSGWMFPGTLEPFTTAMMGILLALLVISTTAFFAVRWALRHGVWFRLGGGFSVRRWYAPTTESDETLLEMQANMRKVCMNSIDTVLDYRVLQAEDAATLRRAVDNKIILEIWSQKEQRVVAFHMAFWTALNVHLGLVMVDRAAQGRGLQRYSILNIGMLVLDWFSLRFRLTDIGYSSSAFRLMSESIYKAYPNLYYDVKPEQFHTDIVNCLLKDYRQDMGISSVATFDPDHFVVKKSNASEGGGANALVEHVSTRTSRTGVARQYLDDLLEDEDEQLYVGEANLFAFIWRSLPLMKMLMTYIRWATVFVIFALHNYLVANASWYTPTVLKLIRFRHIIRGERPDTSKPAIYVCNHYSYLDALVIHAAMPGVHIIAKKDLTEEIPPGALRNYMLRVWTRGGFVWYDRKNKDTTIHARVSALLAAGKSVVVFSEGTSKRSGPPSEFKAGALRMATENNVPLIPVAIRYSMPIGVAVGDNAVKNAVTIMKMRNIVCGINFAQPIPEPDNMEDVHAAVTDLWKGLEPDMHYKSPEPQGGWGITLTKAEYRY